MQTSNGDFEQADFGEWIKKKNEWYEKIKSERDPEELERRQGQDDQRMAANRKTILERWGVPSRLIKAIQELKPNGYITETDRWKATEQWCLIMNGSAGTGKSTAAAWWLYQEATRIAENGKAPYSYKQAWFRANDLMLVGNYNKELLETLWSSPWLVLDDLGNEFMDSKGNFSALLYGIVDHRYGNERKTIITTNMTKQELSDKYDRRVYDRLRHESALYGSNDTSRRA